MLDGGGPPGNIGGTLISKNIMSGAIHDEDRIWRHIQYLPTELW